MRPRLSTWHVTRKERRVGQAKGKILVIFCTRHTHPPTMPSTMAAASSSSRPAKTALSSKVQGLKFMQRAEARQAVSDSPATNSSSAPKAPNLPQAPQTDTRKIITVDDNPEHWSFASTSSVDTNSDYSSEQQVGWNSWLLETGGDGSASAKTKAKKRKSVGDDEVQTTHAHTSMGRRTFGTFAGEGENEEEEEEDDSASSTPHKKSRPRAPRRRSLEPDFEEGQSLRDRSKAKAKAGGSKAQRKGDQFIKPGTMNKKTNNDDGDDEEDDGIDVDSFDLSESFADEERQTGSRRKNKAGSGGEKKNRRRKSGGGGGGISGR